MPSTWHAEKTRGIRSDHGVLTNGTRLRASRVARIDLLRAHVVAVSSTVGSKSLAGSDRYRHILFTKVRHEAVPAEATHARLILAPEHAAAADLYVLAKVAISATAHHGPVRLQTASPARESAGRPGKGRQYTAQYLWCDMTGSSSSALRLTLLFPPSVVAIVPREESRTRAKKVEETLVYVCRLVQEFKKIKQDLAAWSQKKGW